MVPSRVSTRVLPFAAAVLLGLGISGCVGGLSSVRTQGYELSESALKQIRPGQSQDLVIAVLGTPQTTNTFGDETAFYYIETKIEETAFGLKNVRDRKVLAIYFDNDRRVKDRALYGLADGRVVTIETRRTPSFGQDKTFVQSIIDSF